MHDPSQSTAIALDFWSFWGDRASVAGFFLTVVGFGFTFWGIIRAKDAADAAAKAAQEAKDKILKQSTVANFSLAISIMEDTARRHRKKDWEGSLERQFELRRILVELKDGGGGISLEQATLIQGCIQQFKTIEEIIEKHTNSGKPEPKVEKINGVVRDQIQVLQEISTSLKNT